MNWPNRLSLIRIASVPVITLLLVMDGLLWTRYAALFLFIFAAATDFVDGHIARKYNMITNFGKFIDPVADKLLVLCTMVMLSFYQMLPAWILVVMLFRELAVDGLRLVAVEQGRVIAAGKLGKLKTISQMVMLVTHLVLFAPIPGLSILAGWLQLPSLIAVLILTVWSGVDYFVRNKEVLHG